jgi:SAM-dependent methyltransferase
VTTLRKVTDLRTPPRQDGDLFSERVRQHATGRRLHPVHILEAGCGWGTGLELGDLERRVTGVDMDTPRLRAHTRTRTDLDSWHLGDLRTAPMPPRAFDIVHAPYLIERVPCAELVLDRFVAALKPGGLLLMKLRDRDTAYGYLDRMLPSWTRGTGQDEANLGMTGGPPPAIYDKVASSRGMHWYCVMRGLVISEEYAGAEPLPRSALRDVAARALARLTRGRLTAQHDVVTLVIRKPENRLARVI